MAFLLAPHSEYFINTNNILFINNTIQTTNKNGNTYRVTVSYIGNLVRDYDFTLRDDADKFINKLITS